MPANLCDDTWGSFQRGILAIRTQARSRIGQRNTNKMFVAIVVNIPIIFHHTVIGALGFFKTEIQDISPFIIVTPNLRIWQTQQFGRKCQVNCLWVNLIVCPLTEGTVDKIISSSGIKPIYSILCWEPNSLISNHKNSFFHCLLARFQIGYLYAHRMATQSTRCQVERDFSQSANHRDAEENQSSKTNPNTPLNYFSIILSMAFWFLSESVSSSRFVAHSLISFLFKIKRASRELVCWLIKS